MEQTKELLSVPLSSLESSPYNVRRHSAGQVEGLAALIDVQGLLHNLVVTEHVVGRATNEANFIAEAVGLIIADWWEPTAGGCLNHVPKSRIVEALKEAGPGLDGDGVGAIKREVLVSTAASPLAGRRWLPVQLRRPPV